jgi:peptidoglycan/LPS O-acetylase OafA/YrhL
LFVGEQWTAHRFPGTNGAYWSLSFEVWYYVAFAAFCFAPGQWKWLAATSVIAFIGPKVAVMFPTWLMGVATYRICMRQQLTKGSGWALFLIPIAALIGYEDIPHPSLHQFDPLSLASARIMSTVDDYIIAALFSLHIIGFATICETFGPWLERYEVIIRWVAGATFSVYLVHLPLLYFLSAISPWPKNSGYTVTMLLVLTPLLCLAFAEVSERRKNAWRAGLWHIVAFMRNGLPGPP